MMYNSRSCPCGSKDGLFPLPASSCKVLHRAEQDPSVPCSNEQDLDPGVPCFNEQDPCVEGDLLLVGVIDLIWDSIIFPAFDQQVEKSVPCIIISICTVAQLVLYLCMTSELSFTC